MPSTTDLSQAFREFRRSALVILDAYENPQEARDVLDGVIREWERNA